MRCGIMQPYFFPYIGYFALISRVDQWVIFDVTQFTPKSWMTRNRILNLNKDWIYISCNINKGSRNKKIFEITLKDQSNDLENIKKKLLSYYKKAPYYDRVINIIENIFIGTQSNKLVDLNHNCLKQCCNYLDISYNPIIWSEQNISLSNINHSGSWALEISSLLGATEYINPVSGRDLFKVEEFKNRNIKLKFLDSCSFFYNVPPPFCFVDNLSIIDVMMWNEPKQIKKQIRNFKLIT